MSTNPLSIFTKPWKQEDASTLAGMVNKWGLDGIELPVRSGYQVEPEGAERQLPAFAKRLGEDGVRIFSVASAIQEEVFAGCALAGVSLIRVIFLNRDPISYWEAERLARVQLDEAARLAEKYGVKVGVQNHGGPFVPQSAMGLYYLVKDYDPAHVCAVWDAGHNALHGEETGKAIDIVSSHLGLVNVKNAVWSWAEGSADTAGRWKKEWTTGERGLASWPDVVRSLHRVGYDGAICLHTEYSDGGKQERFMEEDIRYLKSITTEGIQR
jgi:sugar phosphate isomerase/epimerase